MSIRNLKFYYRRFESKLIIIFLCFFLTIEAKSSEISDSTNSNSTQFKGNLQLNNNGISPVPYFTLGEPAFLTNLFITKGRLSFTPALNFDLKAKPWSFNTWVHYKLIKSKRINFFIGNNFSTMFKRRDPKLYKENLQLQRYQMSEINISYKIDQKNMLNFYYWKTQTLDNIGIKSSHFLMLSLQIENLLKKENSVISLNPSIFAINNSLPFSGLFMSQITKFSTKKIPVIFSLQTVETLVSSENAKFNWNVGVNVPF
jgi:hypothetical protein